MTNYPVGKCDACGGKLILIKEPFFQEIKGHIDDCKVKDRFI